MNRFGLFLFAVFLCNFSCNRLQPDVVEFDVPQGGHKCLIIGDWGRQDNANLLDNAKVMNQLACRLTIDAVLTTGDNFYDSGVSDTNDAHWNINFENVFNGECLLPILWYPILGNHDILGNATAQINYSNKSERWNMPSTFYDRWVVTEDSVSVHFVAVDTNPFMERLQTFSEGYHFTNADTLQALNWLDSVLSVGNPDWLVVYGHHPVYPAGRRGTNALIEKLVPLFNKYGVDIYFCGHNHTLELIKTEMPTLYVTSGGGSDPKIDIQLSEYSLFGVAQSGFVLSSFVKDSVQLDFMSKKGERLFSYVGQSAP